jgi:proline iminopeptidase
VRTGPALPLGEELVITEHRLDVPLHYEPDPRSLEAAQGSPTIEIFAREYARPEAAAQDRPWLLYLQGGPGGAGTRYLGHGGWLKAATEHFRVLQLDQRGTGRSHPINRNTLGGAPEEMARVLRALRADSIVKDAERLRRALGVDQWFTHGQSYGGFLTTTYLSFFSEGLAGSMITAGLPPLTLAIDDVYRATYSAMEQRQSEFFDWYPEDEETLARIYTRVRESREIVDGHRLRPGHIQRLGMALGGNTRVHGLHYTLSEAFEKRADGEWGLTDGFKRAVWNSFTHESGPLYTVLHESIYSEGPATNWSAWRVGAELQDADGVAHFSEEAPVPRLTGEMIYPWHVQTDPATSPLFDAAESLARHDGWGPLYDRAQLNRNTVPVAAAVFRDDVYVTHASSLAAAAQINGIQIYERDDLHHDGIAQDGSTIFRELASRIGML